MKKILSIILSLAMLLSTIIIPSAFIVSAEDVTTLNLTYYVDASVESSGDGLTAGTAFKTIAEAVAAAAAQENDTTVANATVYVAGTADFGETVAHKGMITIDGQSTGILNGDPYVWCEGLTEVLAIKGPTTIQNIALSNVGVFATYGYELNFKNVDSTATTNQELYVGNNYQDGRGGDKLVVDGMSYNYGKGAKIHLTPVANNPANKTGGNTEVIFNSGSFMRLNINEGIYQGLVSFTFNGGSPAAYFQGAFLNGAPTFNDGLQFIFNNGLSKESFISTAFDTLEAAKGVWFVSGNADGKLIATDTAGVFNVEGGAGIAAKAYKVVDGVQSETPVQSENGVLDLSNAPGTYNVTYNYTELYVSETGSDDNNGLTADSAFATINKAIEKFNGEDGTIYVSGTVEFNGGVAHAGMITIDGQGTGAINFVNNKWYQGINDALVLLGPTTFKNIKLNNVVILATNGYELKFENVDSTATTNQELYVGNNYQDGRGGDKLVVDGMSYNYGKGAKITLTPVANNPANKTGGNTEVIFNSGSFMRLNINEGIYQGLVSFTFNGGEPAAYFQGAFLNGAPTFNDGLQFIFNNDLSKESFIGTAYDTIEAAKGVWFVSSNTDGKIIATETAGIYNVETKADYIAVAKDTEGNVVAKSANGVLDLSEVPGTYAVTYEEAAYTEVYVSETGSDENSGATADKPLATINKAIEKFKGADGTIYVSGTVEFNGGVAHTGKIIIDGQESAKLNLVTNKWYQGLNDMLIILGPTTFKNIDFNNIVPMATNGYELNFGENVGFVGASHHHLYVGNNYQDGRGGDKLEINSYTSKGQAGSYGTVINLTPVGNNPANKTGGKTDVEFNGGEFTRLNIKEGIYEGLVTFTFNGGNKAGYYQGTFLDGNPTFNDGLQFIFNNGISKDDFIGSTFDSLTAAKGVWFVSSAADGKLTATETAGKFNVSGELIAVAKDAEGNVIAKSANGVLDLSEVPGTYNVTYEMPVVDTVYVSETGSDENDGLTPQTAFATINRAISRLDNADGTIYVSGTVEFNGGVAHTGKIIIDGQESAKLNLVTNKWYQGLNDMLIIFGPTTFKNIDFNNIVPMATNGYELNFGENVGFVGTSHHHLYVGNNYQDGRGGDKLEINSYTSKGLPGSYGTVINLTPVGNNPANKTGGKTDVEFNGGEFTRLNIREGIYEGLVTFTFNGGNKAGYYQGTFLDGNPTFNDGLQFIFNNGISKDSFIGSTFDGLTAAKGVWFVSSTTDGILTATETAGIYTVTSNLIAVAKDAEGNVVARAENGVLDLSAKNGGVYNVTYVAPESLISEVYVDAVNGSDSNAGTENAPVATIKMAITLLNGSALENKTVYIMGTVPTLPTGQKSEYVTHTDMITFKGYDETSTLNIVGAYYDQLGNMYAIQGPTTFEDLKLIRTANMITNGKELVINNCAVVNTNFNIYVGDVDKGSSTKVIGHNKLTLNGFSFVDNNGASATWFGLVLDIGAFGNSNNVIEGDVVVGCKSGPVDIVINKAQMGGIRFTDRTIAGDVNITVNDMAARSVGNGGFVTTPGDVTVEGAFQMVVNNAIGTLATVGNLDDNTSLEAINAQSKYFVFNNNINGNFIAMGDEVGSFKVNSKYVAQATDANGAITRSNDTLTLAAGKYDVIFYNSADINGDGVLDIRDLIAIKELSAEMANIPQADINLNGTVNGDDLVTLKRFFLKVEDIAFSTPDEMELITYEDIELQSDADVEAWKADIDYTDDSNVPTDVTTYYVSTLDADSQNLGTIDDPFTSIEALNAAFKSMLANKYDTTEKAVLFERGSVLRTSEGIYADNNTYYGAYGEGAMPVISGSLMDYADSALWTSTDGGTIWTLQLDPSIDAGNIVMYKDGVEAVAHRVQELGHVVSPADYWYDAETGVVYFYSNFVNPGSYFDSIEIVSTPALIYNFDPTVDDKIHNSYFTVENLEFKFAAIHGMSFSWVKENAVIRNCVIGWAGGSYSGGGSRYGNGIEFWDVAKNVVVENNYIYQCYDAAVTYQGKEANRYDNITFYNNLMERCSFGFEFWGTSVAEGNNEAPYMTNINFDYNIMRLAAGGFGMVSRAAAQSHAFIMPYQMDASELIADERFDVNITNNIFDTSYKYFIYGENQDTVDAINFSGNIFYQTGVAPELTKGNVAVDADAFAQAVEALEPDAEIPNEGIWE